MEVFYPDWLANPVLVLKKNNTWRMCIDYTSLNKACPKDPFALPRIDQVIDSTAGYDLLSFLDAYLGYHQIPLYQPDHIKTSFITPYGAYCYVTMPFGLKTLELLTSEPCSDVYRGRLGEMCTLTWTTWW
jgi:putative transposase